MKTKSPKKTTKRKPRVSLAIRPATLTARTKELIQLPTPLEFTKKRPGKGGKEFTYVEGGYVIARLNQIFSPVGWDFEVVEHILEVKEVVVKGQLTIKDHVNGYEVKKTQYGTHPRYAEVPLGDSLKAASTDCLKKCASLFGVALDVYWQQLDQDKLTTPKKATRGNVAPTKESKAKSGTIKKADLMKLSIEKIKSESDLTILTQYKQRVVESDLYSDVQKKLLYGVIDGKLKDYDKNVKK